MDPPSGDENRVNNMNVTSQSVTYVLNQMCYRCVDYAEEGRWEMGESAERLKTNRQFGR